MPGTYNSTNGETFPITLSANQKIYGTVRGAGHVAAGSTNAHTFNMGYGSRVFSMKVSASRTDKYLFHMLGAYGRVYYCTIEATGGSGSAIYLLDNSDNCVFHNNVITTDRQYMFYFAHYGETARSPTIQYNVLTGTDGGVTVLYAPNTADPFFRYLTFQYNTVTAFRVIDLRHRWFTSDAKIIGNKLIGSSSSAGPAIYMKGNNPIYCSGTIRNNEIRGFQGNEGYGMYLYNFDPNV
jgi:hypothetical protein